MQIVVNVRIRDNKLKAKILDRYFIHLKVFSVSVADFAYSISISLISNFNRCPTLPEPLQFASHCAASTKHRF